MKKKYNYNFIKQLFEKEGYQLLSKEYIGYHKHLNFICSNGHKHKITLAHFLNGVRCSGCYGNSKPTLDKIKQSFKNEGYVLLSNNYKNNNTYLNYICPNSHKHKTTWHNWILGKRCPKCYFTSKISKPEKEIAEYIKTIYTGEIIENDRTLIRNPKTGNYLELDIWLPEIKKAIEYNGIFWHNSEYQKEKDNYKIKFCIENNISLFIINDSKWRKNKEWNKINQFIES